MTQTIFDLVNAREIGTYWTAAAENKIPLWGQPFSLLKSNLG